MRLLSAAIVALTCSLQGCASIPRKAEMMGPSVDGVSLGMTPTELRQAIEKQLGHLGWLEATTVADDPSFPGLPRVRARVVAATAPNNGLAVYMLDLHDRPFFYMQTSGVSDRDLQSMVNEAVRTYGPPMITEPRGEGHYLAFAMDTHGRHLPATPQSLKVCDVKNIAQPDALKNCQWVLSLEFSKTSTGNGMQRSVVLVSVPRYREAVETQAAGATTDGGAAMSRSEAASETRTSHVMSQLHISVKSHPTTSLFWLNNEEVMFAGWPRTPGGSAQDRMAGIYIWNVRQNTFRKYADLSDPVRFDFQYDNGNILYTREPVRVDPQPSPYMLGKMGHEQRAELTPKEYRSSVVVDAALGPRGYYQYRPGDGTTSLAYRLRPEHGVLLVYTLQGQEAVMRAGDQPVRLVRPDGSPPVVLPIPPLELGSMGQIWYSEYTGKYVIFSTSPQTVKGGNTGRGLDEPQPVWLVSPDGKLDTLEIPPGRWPPNAVFPTRAGLFWVSNWGRRRWSDAGGWVLANGKPRKLFDFPVEAVSVSPDGCTISYAIGNEGKDEGSTDPWIVQALDVCADRGKH